MSPLPLSLKTRTALNAARTAACGLVFLLARLATADAAPNPLPGTLFKTPVTVDNIDPYAYTEWCDGHEKPLVQGEAKETLPQWVLWTDKTAIGIKGVPFGAANTTGPRHLRIGFHSGVPVGTLLVRAGGRASVLKPTANYPGDMNDDSQWIAGQRLRDGKLSQDEANGEDFALWIFPPGTTTRALRFTHTPEVSDSEYAGKLGAVMVLADRFMNAATEAVASASTNNQKAPLLNDESNDTTWKTWENREALPPLQAGMPTPAYGPPVSKDRPEWVMLTWPNPVKISALVPIWAGFGAAEVQTYKGPANKHPRDAGEGDWETLASFDKLQTGYPTQLWPQDFDFGQVITTRAVRLRIVEPTKEVGHQKPDGGTRVWLGELLALTPLADAPLQATRPAVSPDTALKPPIPIHFTLREPGFVTLVIENKAGVRVRNLVSETWFPAGDNVAWWDGLDDTLRDTDAARHGIYKIPARFVEPGEYRVRGLSRGAIDPHYEFSIYTTGNPPWDTPDHTGAWLANHTPPISALFVPPKQSPTGKPAVYLGCYVTEGPDGLAWVDLEGRKLGGKKWVGGNWTAAPYLARDAGANAESGTAIYVASVWETGKQTHVGELRITALPTLPLLPDKTVLKEELGSLGEKPDFTAEIGGLAVNNGVAVVSLTRMNQLFFVDLRGGKVVGKAPLDSPRGLAFDANGHLLALTGRKLVRFDVIGDPAKLGSGTPVVSSGLDAPVGITLDDKGNIYISDHGDSHQVKVFTPIGQLVRAIGKAGVPKAGPYDPLHMNNPAGIAVDSNQQLWVTENDFLPKRVSVWTLDGKFVRAFYGPGKYGGGGSLDPQDKTRFYYAEESRGAMEFKIDWQTGASEPVRVYHRAGPDDLPLAFRSAGPETALYHDGQRYFTNCYNSSPTSGHGTAFLFADRDGLARPVAAMGRASQWDVLKGENFKSRWPEGVDLDSKKGQDADALFAWCDANGDGQVQPEEVTFQKAATGGVTVMPDLSFCIARVDDKAMRYAPIGFSAQGVPRYDLAKGETLASGVEKPASSGGDQVLAAPDGWTVVTLGMQPFDARSFTGARNGVAMWSYPNLWPGLHASHEAPIPDQAGELTGPTRLVGGLFNPKGSSAGPLWAINGNHGNVYIFTADGLIVATLFKDMRLGKRWGMPVATRNMRLDGLTLGEENFWPTLTQSSDGLVYLVDGARSSLVRLDGFEALRRLPDSTITLTQADLEKSRVYQVAAEAIRQRTQGSGVLEVATRANPPAVNGKLDDWAAAQWVDIDKRGVKAYFNSTTKPYDVSAAVAVAGDRLYAMYRTGGDDKLLENSGEMPIAPFKTGGALDLMIGTDQPARPDRAEPVPGDVRLLVTTVKGKPRAVLYRAVVPGTPAKDKVPFSSPARTITFDKVDDVTAQVQFAANNGNYEFSVPLSVLGVRPLPGASIKGDIGILRGADGQTTARIYWSNKATGITADVPAEAALIPGLWGTFHFNPAK